MNREILFRGQTRRFGEKINMNGDKLPGEWVYGGVFPGTGDFSIIYGGKSESELKKFVVYSDTVGQYTGLTDKNGIKIFEGDIVEAGYYKWKCEVVWDSVRFICFTIEGERRIVYADMVDKDGKSALEVIGNIYDGIDGCPKGENGNE